MILVDLIADNCLTLKHKKMECQFVLIALALPLGYIKISMPTVSDLRYLHTMFVLKVEVQYM